MNILEPTGVKPKVPGDSLTSSDINAINSTVNALVDVGNEFLQNICNSNAELNNMTRKLSLAEAVAAVPVGRRRYGLKVRFLGPSGVWLEYIYNGENLENSSWNNETNWKTPLNVIDGGEW